MAWLTAMLAKYPELGVYLALGIGYWVGNRKLGGFSLGGVTGSLLAGMLVGWAFEVPVSGTAKSVLFLLFLFGIGYEVGPRFVTAMKGDGWRFAVLGAAMPMVGGLTAWGVCAWLDVDLGLSAGLMSGALTQSAAMGTAADAIQALGLPAEETELLVAHIGVADALCYIGGALGVIFTCTLIGPALLRIDVKAESLALEKQYGIKRESNDVLSAWQPFVSRAYMLPPGAPAVGMTVEAFENRQPGTRLFINRLRRGGAIREATPGLVLEAGDVLVVSARREVLVNLLGPRVEEVEDPELLSMPVASYEVFVSNPKWAGRTLAELGADDAVDGVFLRRLERLGTELPIGTQTTIERGDVVVLIGQESSVKRAAAELGEIVKPSDVTDFVAVGFAIFLGALLGAAVSFPVGALTITIGTSVGTLLSGIVTGHLRSRRPLFARVPDGAVKFMQTLGLAGFVGMVGIGAGPHFLQAVRESGLGLLLGGLVVTFVPLFFGLWFGRVVLKINPLLLLGAISGAQTFTAGLAALQEKAESPVAVMGYSGAVPVAHVFLTTWGTLIVLIMAP